MTKTELQAIIEQQKVALNEAKAKLKKISTFDITSETTQNSNAYHTSMKSICSAEVIEAKFKDFVLNTNDLLFKVNKDFKRAYIKYIQDLIKKDLQ